MSGTKKKNSVRLLIFTVIDSFLFLCFHLHCCQPSGSGEEDSEDDDGDADGGGDCDGTLREDNSSEMEVDAPQCQSSLNQKDTATDAPSLKEVPEVADGWTVVSSRHRRGRKN